MAESSFVLSSEQELIELLRPTFAMAGSADAEICKAIEGLFREHQSVRPGYGLITPRWIVKKADLQMLELVGPVVIAGVVATCNLNEMSTIAALVASAIVTFFALKARIDVHQAPISPAQYAVLSLLSLHDNGLSESDLRALLEERGHSGIAQGEQFESIIAELQKLTSRSGGEVAAIQKTHDGLWRLAAV